MRRLALAICVGTATLLVSGCGATDRARLNVSVDVAHGSFPASWHVSVEESRALPGKTTGRTRTVAARGAGSAVFDLRGRGRYRIGVTVEPPDHSTGAGCAQGVDVHRDVRYSATIRLTDRTCSVVVLRQLEHSIAGRMSNR